MVIIMPDRLEIPTDSLEMSCLEKQLVPTAQESAGKSSMCCADGRIMLGHGKVKNRVGGQRKRVLSR